MESSQLLKNICYQANRNISRINNHHPHTRLPTSQPSLSLSLPKPAPIGDYLLQRTGLNRNAADRLSRVFIQQATLMKTDYEHRMNDSLNACLQAGPLTDVEVSHMYESHAAIYRRDLARWTNVIVESSQQKVVALSASKSPPNVLQSSIRNKEINAILERAFVRNPYPKADEKRRLASQCGIEYRQVHVWFQNKRSRFKREGGHVQRLAFIITHEDTPKSCSQVAGQVASSMAPSSPISTQPSSDSAKSCPFHIERPPHAFPKVFSVISDYNPFPALDGSQAFNTPWLRHAATEGPGSKVNDVIVDIEELCSSLSCLTLVDEQPSIDSLPCDVSSWSKRTNGQVAACFPCLLSPATAPLPALIPTIVAVCPTHSSQTSNASPSSLPRHTVCVSPSPTAPVRQVSARKHSEGLPLRVSQSLPKLARDSAHPYRSHNTPIPRIKSARLSRRLSPSSIDSDDSCSSRASSASLESPPPLTPPQLSVELPRSRKVSSPDLVFSPSEDLDHLFSDSDAPTLNFLGNRRPQIAQ